MRSLWLLLVGSNLTWELSELGCGSCHQSPSSRVSAGKRQYTPVKRKLHLAGADFPTSVIEDQHAATCSRFSLLGYDGVSTALAQKGTSHLLSDRRNALS
jgi:hypothetical protein